MDFKSFLGEIYDLKNKNSFKISLLFSLGASLITCTLMFLLYISAHKEIYDHIDNRLVYESARLKNNYEYQSGLDFLSFSSKTHQHIDLDSELTYCITNKTNNENLHLDSGNDYLIVSSKIKNLCQFNFQKIDELKGRTIFLSKSKVMRVLISPVYDNNHILVLGYNTKAERKVLLAMTSLAIIFVLILVSFSFFGAYYISKSIVKATQRIAHTAKQIASGEFGKRIFIKENDSIELRDLANDLNFMLDKIDKLITSQRQVTNNIAHDLRSPLNRMRSRMEVALIDRQSNKEKLQDALALSIEDCQKLLNTFNAILSIAQVESRAKDDFKIVDLSSICEELDELYSAVVEDASLNYNSIIAKNLKIFGNKQLIAQAISNILDNAVKYTNKKDGKISLEGKEENNYLIVSISDNGEGIAQQDKSKVLERFVRLDNARTSQGNGLGLSLVEVIMKLHNGEIKLLDNKPQGLRVELIFPKIV